MVLTYHLHKFVFSFKKNFETYKNLYFRLKIRQLVVLQHSLLFIWKYVKKQKNIYQNFLEIRKLRKSKPVETYFWFQKQFAWNILKCVFFKKKDLCKQHPWTERQVAFEWHRAASLQSSPGNPRHSRTRSPLRNE